MNVGLMQICTPLSPSLQIFRPVMTKIKYMYTTTRACTSSIVNVSVIIEPFHQYSRNGNLSTLILILTLPTAYFSVIFSWRLLSNSYTMGCPPVRGDNPGALARGGGDCFSREVRTSFSSWK